MKVNEIWIKDKFLVPQASPPPAPKKPSKQKLLQLRREILQQLTKQRFVSFAKQPHFYYDNQLNCLWLFYDFKAQPEEMFKYVDRLTIYAFKSWGIPTVEQLQSITWEQLSEQQKRFQGVTVLSATPSKNASGYRTVTLGTGTTGTSTEEHTIIPLHKVAQRDIFSFILAHALVPKNIPGIEEKLTELYQMTTGDRGLIDHTKPIPSLRALQQHLLESDYQRARLPVLEPAYLFDMGKGLWELHQPQKPDGDDWVRVNLETPWESRNPEKDVREGVVAIDFGTSSTVVAYREHGKTTLLRVGMNDFFQVPKPEDYQNPTILAFINLPNLLKAWNSEVYRPTTSWEDLSFSHEALNQYRAHEAERRIVASMITNLKQWPLRNSENKRIRLTDQQTDIEIDIEPVNNPMPVYGQPLTIDPDAPLDPLELYAYYLGLFINHRVNGLFLEYHMTFPITYPKEVKDQIRASFARGLQRSLPAALIHSKSMKRFQVREEASEPAAYAACALSELDIEPSEEGTAYGVFDFGGGTADFDFGIYRLPTEDEEDQGYESVIKHFGASGDMYLGGENLIANLAYLAFQQNLETCRTHRIPFSCPPEAEYFPGHEMFIDQSHVAQTNNALLMAKMRPIWEDFVWIPNARDAEANQDNEKAQRRRRFADVVGDSIRRAIISEQFDIDAEATTCDHQDAQFTIDLELLNRDREKVAVSFTLNRDQLNHYLVKRVGNGILRFFMAMQQAFNNHGFKPKTVHILQAGNSCRSLLVQSLFAAILQKRMIGWKASAHGPIENTVLENVKKHVDFGDFIVHRPPQSDPKDPYRPTAKTGVAIGLLKLIPGETLLAQGPTADTDTGEAPFRFYVGRLKRGFFHTIIQQNGNYQEWKELGIPTRGVFNLAYSTSPQAGTGTLKRGSPELQEKSLRFYQGMEGKRLFIRATGPSTVELYLADSLEQILKQPEKTAHREVIDLG
ncbi:hypothetical protein ACQZV8_00980 [Magnetococcales bacterium HHB-1]